MTYRPDIDGLRAVAVLAVILFHLGIPGLTGGFVGVDVFFVISGYLITAILLKELGDGTFRFSNFYIRRVRRILPVFYVVCFVSAALATMLFLPATFEGFGKSLIAAVLFGSNIFFYTDVNYFASPVMTKPLLHTWSLAVEEQFYIVFPVVLYLIAKYCKNIPSILFAAACGLGFFLAVGETYRDMDAAFYLPHARAWEFLAGSVLAAGCLPAPGKKLAHLAGLCGFLLLAGSLFLLDENNLFPGFNALYPCAGAFLLIYAGTKSFAGKILSLPFMTYIGKRSYSLYLWHWPLITFLAYTLPGDFSWLQKAGLLLATFVLSEVSYRAIEQPFRHGKYFSSFPKAFYRVAGVSLFLTVIGAAIVLLQGAPQRFHDLATLDEWKSDHIEADCVDIAPEDFTTRNCKFGDVSQPTDTFLVWGDSHAYAMMPGIEVAAGKHRHRGTLSSNSGCPPVVTIATLEKKCREANRTALSYITPGMTVFLVARWTYYQDKSPINREGPSLLHDKRSLEHGTEQSREVLKKGLQATIAAIRERKAVPVLVGPGLEFYRDVPDSAFLLDKAVTIEKSLITMRNAWTEKTFSALAAQEKISYIRPTDVLCGTEVCAGEMDGQPLYFDNDHLSRKGARSLAPAFEPVFQGRAHPNQSH